MKKRIAVISVLLVLTAILSVIYLRSRDSVKPGSIIVQSKDKSATIQLSDMDMKHVNGTITNKKGETKEIDSEGILLADIPSLLPADDYSRITVISDDEYKADLDRDELGGSVEAWLVQNDGSIRLVVFGDKDSKRDVKNVVRVEIE